MKVLGLLGGMSWESTIPYYRTINEQVKARLGGLHSAKSCSTASIFRRLNACSTGRLGRRQPAAGRRRSGFARRRRRSYRDLHQHHAQGGGGGRAGQRPAADSHRRCHGAAGAGKNIRRVGLLGTRFTMEQTFYRGRLQELHGIDVVTPVSADRDIVHRIIYDELCQVKFAMPRATSIAGSSAIWSSRARRGLFSAAPK